MSDFLAGTLFYCYEEGKISLSEKEKLFEKLKEFKVIISHHPYQPTIPCSQHSNESLQFREVVSSLSCLTAKNFLNEKEKSRDESTFLQVSCLDYLLNCFCYENPERYISAAEISEWLKDTGKCKDSSTDLVGKIIRKMRNQGVLISSRSSSPAGYKLPYSEGDLYDFVENLNSKTIPMLQKIKICRDRILTATGHELDILNDVKYDSLSRIIETIEATNI